MSIDEFEDTGTLASLFTDENVAVQLAATTREHAEVLQHTQPGQEATDIQDKHAEEQAVPANEIQGIENALGEPQQVVHFLDSISVAKLFYLLLILFVYRLLKTRI